MQQFYNIIVTICLIIAIYTILNLNKSYIELAQKYNNLYMCTFNITEIEPKEWCENI